MYSFSILTLFVVTAAVRGYAVNSQKGATEHKEVDTGPRLYYYDSTLTWDSSEGFCKQFKDRNLCSFHDLCPWKNGARQFIHDVLPGDHWVAVKGHDWLEVGDYHHVPCFLHSSRWGPPTWGDVPEARHYKGYVYCCKDTSPDPIPAIAYRYIGKTSTYDMSKDHCRHHGRRLCYSSEVCVKSKPAHGVIRGDHWIAVKDRYNEWIQIGDSSGRTCLHHGPKYGLPTWGTRTDGSNIDWVGYVYCCK